MLKFLKARFPNSKIKFAGKGSASVAFIVDENIIRFSKHGIARYKTEAKVTDFIRDKIHVQIPNIMVVEDAQYPYAIHKMLVGNNWDADIINSLPVKSRKQFIKDYVGIVCALHDIGVEAAKTAIPELGFREFLRLESNEFKRCLKGYFSESEIDALYVKYERFFDSPSKKTALLHYDFTGENSLIDDRFRITGIFDWCEAGLGDVTYEFYKLAKSCNNSFLEEILHEYENQSGIRIDIEKVKEIRFIDTVRKIHRDSVLESIADTERDGILLNIGKLRLWL